MSTVRNNAETSVVIYLENGKTDTLAPREVKENISLRKDSPQNKAAIAMGVITVDARAKAAKLENVSSAAGLPPAENTKK